jgi:hypothetical protein
MTELPTEPNPPNGKPLPRTIPPMLTAEQFEELCEREAEIIPRPLSKQAGSASPFPVEALGDVLGPAAQAIAAKVQCAPAMASQSVLAVASLAAQALADVALPYGQVRPLSLFCLTIAASGDRKTSADHEAMAPVKMREKRLREAFDPLEQDHAIAVAAWRAQRAQIERGKSEISDRRAKLDALGPEPAAPVKPILTLGESTAEGLAKHMPVLPGALGIFSAEGGQFLNGHGFTADAKMRTAASFANLWDGSGLRRLRAGDGLTDLHGRRLAAHLMIQPEAAKDVLGDPVLRDQGLLSRLLIAAPDSLAGDRLWQEPDYEIEPALRRYMARMLSIFEEPLQAANDQGNELTPRALGLSAPARERWIAFRDEVERDMRPGGRFASLRDVAGKAAEQAARLAGVLTLVDNITARFISGDVMARGCDLMSWYLGEAVRMAEVTYVPPAIANAQLILDWIRARGLQEVDAATIQKIGPAAVRRKEQLDPAVEALVSHGWFKPTGTGKARAWRVAQEVLQ